MKITKILAGIALLISLVVAPAFAQDEPAMPPPAGQQIQTTNEQPAKVQAQVAPEQLEQLYHQVWSKIGSEFADHTVIRKSWADWEHKYDGKLKTLEDLDKALSELTGSLGERWTRYISRSERMQAAIAQITGVVDSGLMLARQPNGTYRIEGIMYGSPAHRTALREGDTVKSLGGKDLSGLSQTEVQKLLSGQAGDKLRVIATSGSATHDVELTLAATAEAAVEHKLLPGNIGYVRLPDFVNDEHILALVAAFTELQNQAGGELSGIVLDLRNNGGGKFQNALIVASLFLEKGVIVRSTTRSDRLVTETVYNVIPELPHNLSGISQSQQELLDQLQHKPMVVLINGSTASASEIVSGALKDNARATIVGTTTFGKGVGYQTMQLPNGAILSITSLSYLTPKGFDLSGKGITPDKVAEQPRDATDDVQLTAAVEQITAQIKLAAAQLQATRQLATEPAALVSPWTTTRLALGGALGVTLLLALVVLLVSIRRRRS